MWTWFGMVMFSWMHVNLYDKQWNVEQSCALRRRIARVLRSS